MIAVARTVSKSFSLPVIIRSKSFAACDMRRRRRDYHHEKIRSDPLYAQVVQESRKKWRDAHPHYQQQYRERHAQAVERNRRQQHVRDQRHRLQHLVKNNLALNLRRSPAEVWLLGPAADDLVKNNLADSQLLILQPGSLPRRATPRRL